MTRLSPEKMYDGIDFDEANKAAEKAEQQRELQAQGTVIDYDGEATIAAFKAETARTMLGDRALAEQKRTEVKRDLKPSMAIGGEGMERGTPTLIREPSAASEARTVILPPSERPADKQFHSREDIVAFAKAQGVKTTAPGTPKSFWKNLASAPRDAWRMLVGKPPEYSQAPEKQTSSSMQEVAREPLPDSTPFQAAQTEMARTVSPDQTTWFKVEPTARQEAAPSEQQREYAQVNALREQWKAQGLIDSDGTVSDELRLYPEKHGVGPEEYAKLEAVSKMQQDQFLTESRTVNN